MPTLLAYRSMGTDAQRGVAPPCTTSAPALAGTAPLATGTSPAPCRINVILRAGRPPPAAVAGGGAEAGHSTDRSGGPAIGKRQAASGKRQRAGQRAPERPAVRPVIGAPEGELGQGTRPRGFPMISARFAIIPIDKGAGDAHGTGRAQQTGTRRSGGRLLQTRP
ncbi:hypothetical protein Scani_25000 [Streptomyces caniferus]|uniref:Uncharacterized protein n=1 Tax=Streptomyces caniferus TaxID=285557 RepID=A0A640S6I7_9ACTN|nr:hypothetical protein Scani_25000 [Streptomyces caniferus]